MGGFFGWFLVLVVVLAIFNAEKLPALRQILEEKFKGSLNVAKESSEAMKTKIEKVKTEIDNRKNAPHTEADTEENTPEETEEALQFMSNYLKKNDDEAKTEPKKETSSLAAILDIQTEETAQKNDEENKDEPVDLNKID